MTAEQKPMISEIEFEKIQQKLKKKLDHDRYIHTLGVAYTAASMAMCHGIDYNKAYLAGLLHDCAKCISDEKKIAKCIKFDLDITDSEKNAPYLLHSKLGAYYAEHKYGVCDDEIKTAIFYHTTGRPAMSELELIIFIADYIEPGRYKANRLPSIRKMAFKDLDECAYMILKDTIKYLKSKKDEQVMDPTTLDAYEYYEKKHNRKRINKTTR